MCSSDLRISTLSFVPAAHNNTLDGGSVPVTEVLIAEMGKEVRYHNAFLLVMSMPTDIQINPDPKKQEAYQTKYHIESLEYVDDRVKQRARENGIPVLWLTIPLVEEARRPETYMAGLASAAPNECNLYEREHAVVGRELVLAICEIAPGMATAPQWRIDRASTQNPGSATAR